MRIALGIRAQLLLVLLVFLALPWLGYEYVRELERFLRDAQERALASTAQAVATALHDRPRLFAMALDPIASFARDRANESSDPAVTPSASPEIAQILQGLSRTTARIWVIDRDGGVFARAGTLKGPADDAARSGAGGDGRWQSVVQAFTHPLYRLILKQPTEDFRDDAQTVGPPRGRDVEGALSGILTTDRRSTADGRAQIVSAAHPIWLGDQVRGVVVVEETGNRVLAERNRAFERLFNIVAAVLLIGSVALTLFATRLAARIRRLRDDAEQAIDAQGRVRAPLASSAAGDEIGDLSRSFASVLERLSGYAAYQAQMASRLSHELRTPVAVVRSSLENLRAAPQSGDARVYIDRAQGGLDRLTAILARMTEATRLEQALGDAERERFDAARVVAGCVDGYRLAYPNATFALSLQDGEVTLLGAPELYAQMLDKLVENAAGFSTGGAIGVELARDGDAARLSVANAGPPLPHGMEERLFESMVSVREGGSGDAPHLGLGLYIVRLIAQFHGGFAIAENRDAPAGVAVVVRTPLAA
ncbi:MAG: histidine kinase dimerization/phospho-acceptor domain-containing protein [Casimicrobiaceae bacterium]